MALFPRQIAPNIYWFGNCIPVEVDGEVLHSHLGVYLLKGQSKTLLVDTGIPRYRKSFQEQLDVALAGRSLDFIFPTHPEVPHASNLPNLLERYPAAKVVGDTRDYHLYYPHYVDHLLPKAEGDTIDLGGLTFHFVKAVLRDLPSSLWGYEATHRVMFVADGFAFLHNGSDNPNSDDPLHRPGDCTLTSAELIQGLDIEKGEFIVRAALYWSRYVDPDILFTQIAELFKTYPTDIIGPAHGHAIVDVAAALPAVKQTHINAYRSTIML